jgi:multiple sugar transport system substrate-binding protein
LLLPAWFGEESATVAQGRSVNNWTAGAAARGSRDDDRTRARRFARLADSTNVAPLPYWESGGASKGDSWLYQPAPDGHYLSTGGSNRAGGREWLEWLYADNAGRTAGLYRPTPTEYLPAYSDVVSEPGFRNAELFAEWPRLLDQVEFIQETVVGEHYGAVPEAELDDPVALSVGSERFYGEMIRRAVTDSSPREAYEWGRNRLEHRLDEARQRFR